MFNGSALEHRWPHLKITNQWFRELCQKLAYTTKSKTFILPIA
jgi:hypothetical protein